MVAVRARHGDQEAQAVLAPGGVEGGTGVGQDIVQQRSCEALVLDSAGGALKGHLYPVLGPGEQVGHPQSLSGDL